jgi:hypothetical protein
MYIPINQRSGGASGGGGGGGFQPLEAPGTASLVQTLQIADTAKRAKNAEMMRQYERAQGLMKSDLNALAAYDVSAVGVDAAPAMTKRAEALRVQIREANDPVQASALIAAFKKDYDMLVAKETARKEAAGMMTKMVTATGQEMASYNAALPVGQEYNEVDATTLANADAAYRKEYFYNDADGKMYVVGPDGQPVPLEEADFIQDFSAYNPTTRQADTGDLFLSAQSEMIQNQLIAKGGGVWKKENAQMQYNTLSEDNNRQGQTMRLQILEDYQDEGGRGSYFGDENQKKAWQLGPNGFDLVAGNPDLEQAWREVWGDPNQARVKDENGLISETVDGIGWDLLNAERDKWVEYTRFDMDPMEAQRLMAARQQNAGGFEASPYVIDGLQAYDAPTQGSESGLGAYSMVSLKEPIEVEGSVAAEGQTRGDDEYSIYGFGYSHKNELVARFQVTGDDVYFEYEFVDPITEEKKTATSDRVSQTWLVNNNVSGSVALNPSVRASLNIPEGAVITNKKRTYSATDSDNIVLPQTIEEYNNASTFAREIYNRIFGGPPGQETNMAAVAARQRQKQLTNQRQVAVARAKSGS